MRKRQKGNSAKTRAAQNNGPWLRIPDHQEALERLGLQSLKGIHTVLRNRKYLVLMQQKDCALIVVKDGQCQATGQVGHWLIRRVDDQPIRSWKQLQRIKTELAGPEAEALELYPAESRLVDDGNWYHMWVLPQDSRLALGFHWKDTLTQTEDSDCSVSVSVPDEEEQTSNPEQ